MAEADFPKLTIESALDLMTHLHCARTLRDMGIGGWMLRGHCSRHGEIEQVVLAIVFAPDDRFIACVRCARMGITKRVMVEAIDRIGETTT